MPFASFATKTSGLVLAAAALAAAQSAPKQPDPLDLLRNVGATYAAMNTYSAKSTHVIEMNGTNLQNKMEMSMTIAADSVGRFRIDNTGMMGMLIVSDGTTTWLYMPQTNQYSKFSPGQMQAPARTEDHGVQSKDSAAAYSTGGLAMFASFGNPFYGYRSLSSNVKEAKIIRSEKVHVNGSDVDCWVLSVEYESPASRQVSQASSEHSAGVTALEESPSKTLWVDKARYLVYQEDSTTKMTVPGVNEPMNVKNTTKFDSVKVDEPISPDVFTFTPPPGATEMDPSKEIERVKTLRKTTPN